jgi:parallel beta-helix repeat protein
VQGLAFKRVKRGVDMSSSTGVQLQSVLISQTATEGVFAASSTNPVVSGSNINNTNGDAIRAYGAVGLQALSNDISNSGVRLRADGSPATLPSAVWGAIYAGANSLVQNNRLNTIAYDGVAVGDDSTVIGNAVQSFCLVLNDCGAIHPFNAARQTIKDNLLVDGRSNTAGTPNTNPPHAVGIYMDVHTSASTISGNTLANADLGLHVLDSYNNTFSGNLFYGNRQNQIWMQQRLNQINPAQGDVFGNAVLGNNFFPTANVTSINQTTTMASTAPMASYDQNRYSALISPTISAEANANAFKTYSLPDWQAAVGPNGPRNLDLNGKLGAPMAGRAVGIMGAALIDPNNLQIGTGNGVNGWGRGGSPTAPTLTLGGCPVGITNCIRATAAATNAGLMSSPKFPAVKSSWYRMSFDAAVSTTSQGLSIVMRNATNNATISPTMMANGSTTWKRYSFVFQATDDAPITPNTLGARIDFQSIQPNQWVTLSNLELVPMTAAAGDVPYTFLYNTGRVTSYLNCPVTDAVVCASFYSYADSTPVTWPAALAPLKAIAIFAPNASLVDSDNDGIADSQDLCPGTAAGAVVNNEGCPFIPAP